MPVTGSAFAELRERAVRRMVQHVRDSTTDNYHANELFEAVDFRDPHLAELERERVFGAVPIIIAHGSEIAEPLDFISVKLARNDVIVSRQRDGSVRAFVNHCRHRGGQLVSEPSGSCRLFSCPYHRWSYDIDGSLRQVTLDGTFGEFDQAKFGLVELPVEERHGLIWIVDNAARSIDVASWLGPDMDTILGEYRMAELVSIDPYSFEWGANWKVMLEGFLDSYHIKFLHPTSVGKVLYTNVSAAEDFGRHFWQFIPRKTLDGFLNDREGGEVPSDEHYIEAAFLAPNSILNKHVTHVEVLSFRPSRTDPQKSVMDMRIIGRTPADLGISEEEARELWKKKWGILTGVLEAEDCPALAGSQEAMGSQDAGTMILGGNEVSAHLVRREIRRLLASPPL